jgi:hypothetical protein
MKFHPLSLVSLVALLVSCSTTLTTKQTESTTAMPQPLIIYKTNGDFQNNTPVSVSNDRKHVTGYPAPSDLTFRGQLRKPTPLADGYLLDNRGISQNTAFLTLTYEQYSKLENVPSASELFALIAEKSEITEMWRCKRKSTDSLNIIEARRLIRENRLQEECIKLK